MIVRDRSFWAVALCFSMRGSGAIAPGLAIGYTDTRRRESLYPEQGNMPMRVPKAYIETSVFNFVFVEDSP